MTPQTDRVAVITGAGTGIGAASARHLSLQGCAVALVGRREARLQETAATLEGAVSVHPADLTDPNQVRQLAARLRERFGSVDVLVNNAGVATSTSTADAGTSLEDLRTGWLATYISNTLSAVLLRAALGDTLERPGGRVVTVGSMSARTGSASAAYAASKAALEAWMRHDSQVLGPVGATTNVVAPGYTESTELLAGRMSADRRARVLSTVAAGRPATPDEVAAVVAFLCSPAASYVNGQVVGVNGGLKV